MTTPTLPNTELPAGQGTPDTTPAGTQSPNVELPTGQGTPEPGPAPTPNPITDLPAGQDTTTTVAVVGVEATPMQQQLPQTGGEVGLAFVALAAVVLGVGFLRFARR